MEVKYRCNKCGYSKPYTTKDKIYISINRILVFLGLAFLAVILATVLIIKQNPYYTYVDGLTTYKFNLISKEYDTEMRSIAINMTRDCYPDNVRCYVDKIYNNLSDIPYVPSSVHNPIYPPTYVYENGGDCKNTAILTVSLLNSIGTEARVDCNQEQRHCVTIVPYKDDDGKHIYNILVDFAQQKYIYLPLNISVWDYMKVN